MPKLPSILKVYATSLLLLRSYIIFQRKKLTSSRSLLKKILIFNIGLTFTEFQNQYRNGGWSSEKQNGGRLIIDYGIVYSVTFFTINAKR
jgi:hypothetical protein